MKTAEKTGLDDFVQYMEAAMAEPDAQQAAPRQKHTESYLPPKLSEKARERRMRDVISDFERAFAEPEPLTETVGVPIPGPRNSSENNHRDKRSIRREAAALYFGAAILAGAYTGAGLGEVVDGGLTAQPVAVPGIEQVVSQPEAAATVSAGDVQEDQKHSPLRDDIGSPDHDLYDIARDLYRPPAIESRNQHS